MPKDALELAAQLFCGAPQAWREAQGGFGGFLAGALVFFRRGLIFEEGTDLFGPDALV